MVAIRCLNKDFENAILNQSSGFWMKSANVEQHFKDQKNPLKFT